MFQKGKDLLAQEFSFSSLITVITDCKSEKVKKEFEHFHYFIIRILNNKQWIMQISQKNSFLLELIWNLKVWFYSVKIVKVIFVTDLEPSKGHKLRDCFVWNRNERLITPEAFAEVLCDDLKVPPGLFVRAIADAIRAQCRHYKPCDELLQK